MLFLLNLEGPWVKMHLYTQLQFSETVGASLCFFFYTFKCTLSDHFVGVFSDVELYRF